LTKYKTNREGTQFFEKILGEREKSYVYFAEQKSQSTLKQHSNKTITNNKKKPNLTNNEYQNTKSYTKTNNTNSDQDKKINTNPIRAV
jgi:hypothetical protein